MKALSGVLLVVVLILQYRLWLGDGSISEVRQLQGQVVAQAEENTGLRVRNDALEIEVMSLKEDLSAVEERARNELGMIREDEIFYFMIE